MARFTDNNCPKWLTYLPTVDSTNNYAMQLITDGLAHHGDVIWAGHQTKGKGQRGKIWLDAPGENIAMSLMVAPAMALDKQPLLSMRIATAIATYLQSICLYNKVHIKWPNDIFIDDKKTCGILIENVIKGTQWQYAVVGIGVNVQQQHFDESLPHANSLVLATGRQYALGELVQELRNNILSYLNIPLSEEVVVNNYNDWLYKKGEQVFFINTNTQATFSAKVIGVLANGTLVLSTNEGEKEFQFGSISWVL